LADDYHKEIVVYKA